MKILITGASGLVGQNIVDTLQEKHELLTPRHGELDLLNYDAVFAYLQEQKPEMIIHCAGIVGGIQANIKAPVKFFLENMDMGRNLVWAARNCDIKQFMNLGSSCMYPRNRQEKLTEDMVLTGELEPTNEGYAIAKIVVQRLCSYISKEDSSFLYKTLIPCNLYGKWDKFDPKHSHMIPAVINKIYKAIENGDSEVEIWGTGKVRREFMYAGELADFIDYAIDNYDSCPELLNVGLGYDYTINEYYETIAEVLGYKGSFRHDTTKPEGMTRKLVDTSRLKEYGWESKLSLKEGIEKTYQYYIENVIRNK